MTPHPANPHATRLTILIADVLMVGVVLFVVPMLWVADLALKVYEGRMLDLLKNLLKADTPLGKTLRGALIAGAGAVVAVIAQAATSGALGPIWGPVVGALASVVINWLRVQGQ